jgi:hypothetical protein
MLIRVRTLFAPLAFALLAACGGGDDDYWDEFQPRAATVDDIAAATFVFTDFSYGAVFDPSLSRSTTTLAGDDLTLAFARVGAGLPFSTTAPLALEIEADVDDGRIGLTNPESGIAQVCAPL